MTRYGSATLWHECEWILWGIGETLRIEMHSMRKRIAKYIRRSDCPQHQPSRRNSDTVNLEVLSCFPENSRNDRTHPFNFHYKFADVPQVLEVLQAKFRVLWD